jgi:hypothetical protein
MVSSLGFAGRGGRRAQVRRAMPRRRLREGLASQDYCAWGHSLLLLRKIRVHRENVYIEFIIEYNIIFRLVIFRSRRYRLPIK